MIFDLPEEYKTFYKGIFVGWPLGTVGYARNVRFIDFVEENRELGFGRMRQIVGMVWEKVNKVGAITDHYFEKEINRLEVENASLLKENKRLRKAMRSVSILCNKKFPRQYTIEDVSDDANEWFLRGEDFEIWLGEIKAKLLDEG